LEYINQFLLSKKSGEFLGDLSTFERQAIAGLVAEVVSNVFVVPFDVISQRLMISTVTHPTEHVRTSSIVREVWKIEGFKGFYRGMIPTLFTYAPESAICWGVYGALKERTSEKLSSFISSDFNLLLASSSMSGALTGNVTALIFHPADLIRARIQTGIVGSASEKSNSRFGTTSVREVFLDLIRREGWRGLTKGLVSKIFYNSGTTALAMTVYDMLKYTSRSSISSQ